MLRLEDKIIKLVCEVPLLLIGITYYLKAYNHASLYGTDGIVNKFSLISAVALGFFIEAIIDLIKTWYNTRKQ